MKHLKRFSLFVVLIATIGLVPCQLRAGSITYTWRELDEQYASGTLTIDSTGIEFFDFSAGGFAWDKADLETIGGPSLFAVYGNEEGYSALELGYPQQLDEWTVTYVWPYGSGSSTGIGAWISFSSVPEPSSIVLATIAALAMSAVRLRRGSPLADRLPSSMGRAEHPCRAGLLFTPAASLGS